MPTTVGRALVMPAYPPTGLGEVGEIDELVAAGWDPLSIVGVERDATIAERLYDHYYTSCQIHCEEAAVLLARTEAYFGYVHTDFCSYLDDDNLHTIEAAQHKLMPVARLRASVAQTRRQRQQMAFENHLRRSVITPLLVGAGLDAVFASATGGSDSTEIVAVIWLLNHFFGMTSWEFADWSVTHTGLPPPAGSHLLANLTRFSYHEVTGHTVMHTLWADALRLAPQSMPSSDWVVEYLQAVLHQAFSPIATFNETLHITNQ